MKPRNVLIIFILIIFTVIYLFINSSMLQSNAEVITQLTTDSSGYFKYRNNPYGYEIVLMEGLFLNEEKASVKTRFESDDIVVDVLYDNFKNTIEDIDTYNNYGNKGLKNNPEFIVTKEYDKKYNDYKAHIVVYQRKKLLNNIIDRNYYATIAIERSSTEVVTVFIKSTAPIKVDKIMPDFQFVKKVGTMKNDKLFKPKEKQFDTLTKQFYLDYFINNEKIDFGIFEPSFPFTNDYLKELEIMYNYNFPVVLMYNSFELPFKAEQMSNAKKEGKVVEYTLYTTDVVDGKEKDIILEILDGKYDDYLLSMANGFNDLDYPVLFRLNNEMNGSWVLYSVYHVGKDTDLYIDCWIYIYNKFKELGVDNLIFVWNPNERSFPDFAYNNYLNYYPGDEYVDVVGLTAYNTGNYYEGEVWRSFTEAFDHFYDDYIDHFNHPFMITEFSCAEEGGDKIEWLDDMFEKIQDYDRIKLAILWNSQDFDFTKAEKTISRNYRLDLDSEVIAALKRGFEKFK